MTRTPAPTSRRVSATLRAAGLSKASSSTRDWSNGWALGGADGAITVTYLGLGMGDNPGAKARFLGNCADALRARGWKVASDPRDGKLTVTGPGPEDS